MRVLIGTTMQACVLCFAAAALDLAGGEAVAGPYEDSLAAYQAGDHKKAAKLLEEAAASGDVKAQATLGYFYDNGIGVAVDHERAVKLYKGAAEKGNSNAQLNLAMSYAAGSGVVRDEAECKRWMLAAARQNNANAHLQLGTWYSLGEHGFPKENVRAYMHNLLARRYGSDDAWVESVTQHEISYFQRALSDENLAKGERMADAWPKDLP
jgi:uncharacterized protein